VPRRSLYNNIRTPSQLQPSATYYLFKEHIEPKWEDPKNMHGGCWTANIPKTATSKQTLDTWWLHSVSAGERPVAAVAAGRRRRRRLGPAAARDR
jgi:hypothetical protein